VGRDEGDEHNALREIIERKRKQTKYQDDLKLMQYLARQGFNYDDIKSELNRQEQ
jgi:SOS response regulatory protein OraA/RecX